MSLPQLSIVIPLYNEAEVFPFLTERLNGLMDKLALKVEVVLVDDGSTDDTALLMAKIALEDARYQCIFLSRNFGHQHALTAGISEARATEAIMIVDGDLQDPPELLEEFYAHYKNGYDVVHGIRKKRKEPFLKRTMYYFFYRLLNKIADTGIPADSGDFSLISRKAANILNAMPEESRYIRGMRSWIGFKQAKVEYERSGRKAGRSKYDMKKLVRLAYNGIFNFSVFPIKFITGIGIFSILLSLIYLAYNIYKKFVLHAVPEGFTALLFTIILFSGVQLLSLGVIGEYVLRTFFQVKQRPPFIISKKIVDKEERV